MRVPAGRRDGPFPFRLGADGAASRRRFAYRTCWTPSSSDRETNIESTRHCLAGDVRRQSCGPFGRPGYFHCLDHRSSWLVGIAARTCAAASALSRAIWSSAFAMAWATSVVALRWRFAIEQAAHVKPPSVGQALEGLQGLCAGIAYNAREGIHIGDILSQPYAAPDRRYSSYQDSNSRLSNRSVRCPGLLPGLPFFFQFRRTQSGVTPIRSATSGTFILIRALGFADLATGDARVGGSAEQVVTGARIRPPERRSKPQPTPEGRRAPSRRRARRERPSGSLTGTFRTHPWACLGAPCDTTAQRTLNPGPLASARGDGLSCRRAVDSGLSANFIRRSHPEERPISGLSPRNPP